MDFAAVVGGGGERKILEGPCVWLGRRGGSTPLAFAAPP